MDFPDFLKNVVCGIHVHNKTIEIMEECRSRRVYEEYASLYESENKAVYIRDYYLDHEILQVDMDFFKRCIKSYGLDVEAALESIKNSKYLFITNSK